ncbi:hypothetical protein [Mycobacterium angelicum]|uniref:Uncharacterized protein n=1 Tax=Mycobacterium angelicum TaxID=470074 RepID=A0A1W9ZXW6_MYCAN|nr:hypothetical protein [Mycobacterium angelicum]MCV7195251.1 hypothetical protein [Mycobacterium angelicum]ORA22672.1 hypothetical protein BST12_08835 [Mycobacterium angelicum]
MADDELDSLYWAPLDAFTAERKRLAAEAKERGDVDTAQAISAARKPTAAAWIVNRLALAHRDARQRLLDLGERLRAAHAAMDGEQIRNLSVEQHALINELVRDALDAAEVGKPSAAVRDDITSTLQAAVADPEVADRLGRLAKPEHWSGFGGFGFGDGETNVDKKADKPDQQLKELNAAVAAAERATADADAALSEREAERDAAARHRDEALAGLRQAERSLKRSETSYAQAREASRSAAEVLHEAKARLQRLHRR